jgi:hypothetical protein
MLDPDFSSESLSGLNRQTTWMLSSVGAEMAAAFWSPIAKVRLQRSKDRRFVVKVRAGMPV